MDFVSIEDWLDDVMPSLPGCTEFVAIDRIRWAAIEFCKRSLISREVLEELDLDANEPLVDVSSSSTQTKLYRVIWVRGPNGFLHPYNTNMLSRDNQRWDDPTVTSSMPRSWVRESETEIRMIPIPNVDVSEALNVRIAVIPSRKATRLHDKLIDEYREGIAAGALSSLLSIANEQWTDQPESVKKAREFHLETQRARAAANKDEVMADLRVQNTPFA